VSFLRYTVRRIAQIVPILVGVGTLTFFLTNAIPGDPVDILIGPDVSPARRRALTARYGLDQPLWRRYVDYMLSAAQGDLGRSIHFKKPVTAAIMDRLPVTMLLVGSAYTFGLGLAIPIGVLSAANRNEWVDHLSRIVALFGVSTPSFWIGLLLIIVFAFHFGWLPSSNMVFPWAPPSAVSGAATRLDVIVTSAKHLLMPTVALGTLQMASVMRIERSSMLETLHSRYVDLARAYGVPERTILRRQAFRPAQLPVVTIIGLNLSTALGGSVLIETVFNINGMGLLIITGIQARDYPLVMGTTLVFAAIFLIGVLITDLSYAYIDPRVSYGEGE